MGVEEEAVRMSAGELGCSYAALILHDDGLQVSEENIKKLLNAANVDCEAYWPGIYAKYLADDMDKHICSPGGGGAAVAAAAAPGAAGSAGAAKEESESDDDDDGAPMAGGGLFDEGGDDY